MLKPLLYLTPVSSTSLLITFSRQEFCFALFFNLYYIRKIIGTDYQSLYQSSDGLLGVIPDCSTMHWSFNGVFREWLTARAMTVKKYA